MFDWLGDFLGGIRDAVEDAISSVKDFVGGVVDDALGILEDFSIGDAGEVGGGIVDAIQDAVDGGVELVVGLADDALGWVDESIQGAEDIIDMTVEALGDTIEDALGYLREQGVLGGSMNLEELVDLDAEFIRDHVIPWDQLIYLDNAEEAFGPADLSDVRAWLDTIDGWQAFMTVIADDAGYIVVRFYEI